MRLLLSRYSYHKDLNDPFSLLAPYRIASYYYLNCSDNHSTSTDPTPTSLPLHLAIPGIVHIMDRDEVVVANMLIGLITKLFFVSTLSMESVVMQFASERKVNDRRRQFLRYVFHEVRVPLNTITMGITVLKDDAM